MCLRPAAIVITDIPSRLPTSLWPSFSEGALIFWKENAAGPQTIIIRPPVSCRLPCLGAAITQLDFSSRHRQSTKRCGWFNCLQLTVLGEARVHWGSSRYGEPRCESLVPWPRLADWDKKTRIAQTPTPWWPHLHLWCRSTKHRSWCWWRWYIQYVNQNRGDLLS